MMKNSIIILLYLSSCITKHNVCFDSRVINIVSISIEEPLLPPYFLGIPFFCKGENGKTILSDVQELLEIYNENSFDMDYETFLTKVLNQQMVLSDKILENKVSRGFYLDKEVVDEYRKNKFEDFILLYFDDTGDNVYRLKIPNSEIVENKANTIFYFLFINNYLTIFDDVIGRYYARPTSTLIENLGKQGVYE